MLTRKQIILTNKAARLLDESHLWPIRGKFNVTERAIRQLRVERRYIPIDDIETYRERLAQIESDIVNDPKNW